MKVKYLAAFMMLLAIGCTQQSSTTAPAPNSSSSVSSSEMEATPVVEPETETQLASTTVSFNVTGMT